MKMSYRERLERYEKEKLKLINMQLSSREYELRIKQIAKDLMI
ncbi:MAG: hypothetical protein ACLU40_03760 [Acutalibacteraceae bacterium]